MKRIYYPKLIISVFVFTALLCGCGKKYVIPVTKQISFTVEAEYNRENYICKVEIDDNMEFKLEFVEPDALKDLKLIQSGEAVTAEMLGLSYALETEKMPVTSVLSELYCIFSDCSGKKLSCGDGNCSYTGRLSWCEYTAVFSPAGLPISAELSDGSMSFNFKDITVTG